MTKRISVPDMRNAARLSYKIELCLYPTKSPTEHGFKAWVLHDAASGTACVTSDLFGSKHSPHNTPIESHLRLEL